MREVSNFALIFCLLLLWELLTLFRLRSLTQAFVDKCVITSELIPFMPLSQPLRDISALRALSSPRSLRGAPEVPHYAKRRQSLGQQMLEQWAKMGYTNSFICHLSEYLRNLATIFLGLWRLAENKRIILSLWGLLIETFSETPSLSFASFCTSFSYVFPRFIRLFLNTLKTQIILPKAKH